MKAHQKRLLPLVMLLICLNVSSLSAQSVSVKPVPKPRPVKPGAKLPVAAQQIEDQQAAAMVEQLLAKAGQKYQRLGVGVWAIRKNGPNFKFFQVVLSYRAGTLVTEVTVAKGHSVHVNDAALALLHLANRLDYAKVGIDTAGDVFVRNEARLKSLDADELTNNIDKIAAAADQVYVEVSSGK
jgi:hypothetical protein